MTTDKVSPELQKDSFALTVLRGAMLDLLSRMLPEAIQVTPYVDYEVVAHMRLDETGCTMSNFEIREQVQHVTMTAEKYGKIQDRLNWLYALESAGVDNWRGYEIAGELYEQEFGK